MILSGLGVTVTISIAAGILGILLAFGLVFLRHRSRKVFNKLIAIYSRLVAGIPAVVILMVLYYIVFGAVDLPAVVVAIVGFALIFGAPLTVPAGKLERSTSMAFLFFATRPCTSETR